MAFAKTTPDALILRIVARIISQVTLATTANCYISTETMDKPPNPGRFVYEVSMPHGLVDLAQFAGAGELALKVNSTVNVTIYSFAQVDRPGWDTEYLTGATQNLLAQVTLVMKALTNHDLLTADTLSTLTREGIAPQSFHIAPKIDRSSGSITIPFDVAWDWNLS